MKPPEEAKVKVSILSAVRSEERYVAEMIESVQSQDLTEWELLIVDDGSTHRTVDIIERYAAGDRRVAVVSQGERLGKVRAFCAAYVASAGEIVILLAGEDRIPPGSLSLRYRTVSSFPVSEPAVGYFKLRTFSDNPRFDNMILPRGVAGSRSGGSITLDRTLAETLFPIDEDLVSEDIGLGYGTERLATSITDRPEIVLEYRIHSGNSNPRQAPFDITTGSIHQRHFAWHALAESARLSLPVDVRANLREMWITEQLRYYGRLFQLVRFRALRINDRLPLISMASPVAYAIRARFYKFFSGRRGK